MKSKYINNQSVFKNKYKKKIESQVKYNNKLKSLKIIKRYKEERILNSKKNINKNAYNCIINQKPHLAEQKPHLADQKPHLADHKPHLADHKPHLEGQKSHLAEQKPHLADHKPHLADHKPHLAEQKPHLEGQKSHLAEQKPHLADHKPHLEGHKSHLADHKPHLEGHKSHLAEQKPHLADHKPHLTYKKTCIFKKSKISMYKNNQNIKFIKQKNKYKKNTFIINNNTIFNENQKILFAKTTSRKKIYNNTSYESRFYYKIKPLFSLLNYKSYIPCTVLPHDNQHIPHDNQHIPHVKPRVDQIVNKNLTINKEIKMRKKQIPPSSSDYRIWMLLAGRGFGKTYAGSHAILNWIIQNTYKHICFISKTFDDVEKVMLKGPSGILQLLHEHKIEFKYQKTQKTIEIIDRGIKIYLYSSDAPESLRGPQFDCVWIDEFAKFDNGEYILNQIEFCLRMSEDAKIIITTTPKPIKILKDIIDRNDSILVTGNTYENSENLPKSYINSISRRYQNTQIGRQEIYGEIIDKSKPIKPEMIQYIDLENINIHNKSLNEQNKEKCINISIDDFRVKNDISIDNIF